MDESATPLFFGEWLQLRRKELDLTRAELAQRAGCSIHAVRKIESGERRPSKQLAGLLAQSLNIPPEQHDLFIRAARGERSVARLPLPARYLHAADFSEPGPPAAPREMLPIYLTPFVGRQTELETLDRLLADPNCRLLTLIGIGGAGKTRLAVAGAGLQRGRFKDGVYFVPLASLSSSDFLVQAIADALSFSIQGQTDPRGQLLDYLAPRQVLLVLDNLEHLLDGVSLLAAILHHAPQVKLLTTSRERLNLQSEWVHVIEGLPVPPDDEVNQAESYTAVELFVSSARRADVGFSLQSEDRPDVVRICQLVEGIPLSIELAAAWVPLLSCGEIVQEIERSFDFLSTSSTDVPDRQRSQRAVFDNSWKLLSFEERCALSRLALFQGGFDRDAALAVADAALALLLTLVSKSLVRRAETGRFDLHEAIRQYALSHLDEDPHADEARAGHARYYLAFLSERRHALRGPAQRDTIRELKQEIDNLRLAWKWAVDYEQYTPISRGIRSLAWLCNVGVMYREGIEQIELVIKALRKDQQTEERQKLLGVALGQQGLLLFRQGKFSQALERFDSSLSILRPFDDSDRLTDPLILMGIIMHLNGEFDYSRSLIEEGLKHANLAGDQFYIAYAIYNLGYLASLNGDYSRGYQQMMEGLAIWRQLGDPSSIALGLNFISSTVIHLGHVEEARALLKESIQLLTEVGDRWGLGNAYRYMGLAAMVQGNYAEAQDLIYKSLELFDGILGGWDPATSLTYLGEAFSAAGDLTKAQGVFQEAVQLAIECLSSPLLLDALTGLSGVQAKFGEAFGAYWLSSIVINHKAATADIKERAAGIILATEAQLSPEQIRAAKARAANMTLGEVGNLMIMGQDSLIFRED